MFRLIVLTYRSATESDAWPFWLFCAKAVAARAESMKVYCIFKML